MTTGSTYHHELSGRVVQGWRVLNVDAPGVETFWTRAQGILAAGLCVIVGDGKKKILGGLFIAKFFIAK